MRPGNQPAGAPGRRDRFRGALLGVVLGDALGAGLEGHRGVVPPALVAQIGRGGSPLRYTDDTAMTFALARSIIECGELDLDHLAEELAVTYEREPHRGYGSGSAHLLREVARGGDWRRLAAWQFDGRGSFGNGAAMRVAPVALHATDQAAASAIGRASATVTHTHPEATDAAAIQAAAVAGALAGGLRRPRFVSELGALAETAALRSVLERVAALPPDSSPAQVAAALGTGVRATEAVPAGIAAAVLNSDLAGTIRFAVAMGGDTDTIASMAGAIAGADLGDAAIPPQWLSRLEGVVTARDLADRLHDMQ